MAARGHTPVVARTDSGANTRSRRKPAGAMRRAGECTGAQTWRSFRPLVPRPETSRMRVVVLPGWQKGCCSSYRRARRVPS